MITAPFNFVPLSDKVFFPSWSEEVSHDIPFEDGESGCIDITITAKSPIFIRNHYVEGDKFYLDSKKNKISTEFCHYNNTPYIPSTSVKGMIRSVLEIMSFGKMSQIDDTVYSLRDLKYSKYMDKIKNNIKCGWLYRDDNGNYKIEDCGTPYRISYDEIERKFDNNFKENFMDGTFSNANSPYKKAHEKYNIIAEDIFTNTYTFSTTTTDSAGRKTVVFEENGRTEGKLVLTGHPSARKEPENEKASGKIYDFVFRVMENPNIYDVDEKVFNNFKFAYFDGRTTQPKESEDWSFWKQRLRDSGRVPIFFHISSSEVSSFGLSYLYKFPYSNSVMKALIGEHTSDEIDLAESIFGYSRKVDNKLNSSRGRVQFSHAKQINNIKPLDGRYILLGSPKASYYPIYIIQNGKEYKTLMDNNAVLSGWKRYPVHKNFTHKCQRKSTQTSLMTPLDVGAKFRLKIRVHNLKSVELGALISALTFHDNDKCHHSLGLGKSYGYGKVKLDIESIAGFSNSKEQYLKAFESAVNYEIFTDEIKWHQSEQIKNLFSMAKEQDDSNLVYMELKDFANEKNETNYLDRYINLDGVSIEKASNLISIDDIQNYQNETKKVREKKEAIKIEKARILKEKEKEVKYQKKFNEEFKKSKISDDVQYLSYFCEEYEDENIKDIEIKLETLKAKQDSNRHSKVDKSVKKAYDLLQTKKANQKLYQKELAKFIKKWGNPKNNKGSEYVLALIKKLDK